MFKIRSTTNIIFLVLLAITIAITMVTLIECHNIRKYIAEEKTNIENIIANSIYDKFETEENLEELYESYYGELAQKADSTIDKIIAFVGCIFGITTIVNTIIALRLPKHYDEKQEKLEKMVNEVYSYAKEAKSYAKVMSVETSKLTTREKINSLSSYIIDNNMVQSSEMYFARGSLFDDINEFEQAERDFNQAKKLGLSEDVYYNAMGVIYTKQFIYAKRRNERFDYYFKKANKFYHKAIDLLKEKNEDASDYYCNIACLYQDNNMHEEALRYFILALEENAENNTIYFNRAISYEEMGEEYYEAAYADYSKCLEFEPDYTTARHYRITLIFKMLEARDDRELLETAKKDIAILKKDQDQLDYYERKIKSLSSSPLYIDELIKRIDAKIKELEDQEKSEAEERLVEFD